MKFYKYFSFYVCMLLFDPAWFSLLFLFDDFDGIDFLIDLATNENNFCIVSITN
jgi:hypothetical protein